MNTTLKSGRKNAGFTLVELAVILVIIGLILSAVSIGKDLQRDAEVQKIKQSFIDQWVLAYNQIYNRTGVVLGDDQTEPRYMVGGLEVGYATDGGVGVQGVRNSALTGGDGNGIPFRICQGQGYLNDNFDRTRSINLDLFTLMDRQGIRMAPGRSEGREDRFSYLDTNGNPQEIQVCFQWNEDSRVDGSGNMMVLRGLTPNLARELDYMIDGKPDSIEGLFRQQNPNPNTTTTNGIAGVEWAANNTFSSSERGNESAVGAGRNMDEDQVILVTAMYKMNQ